MRIEGQALLVRIYVGESDHVDGQPLYEAIVRLLRERGIAGATVLRGIEGFGRAARLHTTRILRLSEDLLTWLTDQGHSIGMPDQDLIEHALVDADHRINGFLRQRYTLPLDDPDGLLRTIAVRLARHTLYTFRPDGPEPPKIILDDKAAADRDLRELRDGSLSLGVSATDPSPAAEPGRLRVSAPSRTFDDDLLGRL